MAKKDFLVEAKKTVFENMLEAAQEPQQVENTAATQEQQEDLPLKPYKPRKTYTSEQGEQFKKEFKTGGRKGLKLPRINLALAPELHQYVQTMARASGISYTLFVNRVIQKHLDEHREAYEDILKVRDSL